jgi:hypothetical protein
MSLGAVGAAVLMLGMQSGTEVPYAPMPAPGAGVSVCPEGICGVEALEGVFEALRTAEIGQGERPVHILQIGDSHTAGDRITGALRARMQARFGAGGRGVLPPGVPYAGYGPMQVEVTATDWPMRTDILAAGRMPMSVGFTGSEADVTDGAVLSLVVEPSAVFDQVQICGEAWLADGELSLGGSTQTQTMRFSGPEEDVWRQTCETAVFDMPQARLDIRPKGRLKLHDVRLTRRAAGVELSNLGVIGGTMQDLALREVSLMRIEVEAWKPDLIVVAFGVNEGFAPALDPAEYEGWVTGALASLGLAGSGGSILILGAPEGLKSGEGGPCGGRVAPASLAMVRDVQRRVAREWGVAYWDWYGRMGGECSAERLATGPEPYMRPDRVHFTSIGAEWIGGVLSDDLMRAYERWKAAKGEAD